jgi:phosphatidate cytidylyltransferase
MASRGKKILIRTAVGGTLGGLLAWLVSLAYDSTDGFCVWVSGAIFTVGCVYEMARMPKAISKTLRMALLAGLVTALAPGLVHYYGAELTDLVGGAFLFELPYPYLTRIGTLGAYLAAALAFSAFAFSTKSGRARPAMMLALSVWAFAPMTSVTFIWSDYGTNGLVALLVLSKIGDIFGYYVGSAIGKSHPFPNISPGKTTAGCVASLVVGILAGGLFSYFEMLPSGSMGIVAGLLGGALVNIAAQAGDLFESRIKRLAEVKDSGNWFGPSGGVLDLADSLLFSVPMALITWPILFA